MNILDPGHCYKLDLFDDSTEGIQLQFIKKEEVDGELKTTVNGTTNEEVIKALVDRLRFLQKRLASRENAIVITKLEEALMWLEKRTADRKERGVEGTNNN